MAGKEKIHQLIRVALGEAPADLAITGGSIVNVYSGEVLSGDVLIKGDRIASVGKVSGKAISPKTRVIDARGKMLIPGLIDGHTHIDTIYSASELVRYAIKGGTTTIITETANIGCALGYEAVVEFLESTEDQPIKILATAPPMVTISPVTEEHALNVGELRQLLRRKEVIGLGEPYWGEVVNGNQRVLDLIAETIKQGKKVDGHSAGASGKKLQAYVAAGVSSCHEPITAQEVKERLRLGLFVLLREGEIRRELEAVSGLKDEGVDLSRLAISTDGLGPRHLINDGYMDFLVQKAIDLGFPPLQAVQMATINVARRFALDDIIGGIAPGKYADIVVIPSLKTIRAEHVISSGRLVYQNGEPLVSPRKHDFSPSILKTIKLNKDFSAGDFAVPASGGQVKVRLIDQVTNLVSREDFVTMEVSEGQLKADASRDILKVAAIERSFGTGKSFIGFIRGMGLGRGAIATSAVWDCGDIIAVGADENDMAQAVNRIKKLDGGIVVCAGGRILAEIALPVGGEISTEPMGSLENKLSRVQKAAADLGCPLPDTRLTLAVLTTAAIPFLRICEHGLVDLRQNKFVDLIVG
jgi:adenine deaminase